MIEDVPSIDTIRAKQKAVRNGTLGLAGTITTIAVSVAVQLLQVTRADAEKNALTLDWASIREDLAEIKREVRSQSERLTRLETQVNERTTRGGSK